MPTSEYITLDEVRRICRELKIRDWTRLKKPRVTLKEAKVILKHVNVDNLKIPLEDFRRGLEVELEHGLMFKQHNVTNNHPLLTGKIVMAHFMEMLDYYKRLEVAEIEGDLLKAIMTKDIGKIQKHYAKLAQARMELARAERTQAK